MITNCDESKNLSVAIHRTINFMNNLTAEFDQFYNMELDAILDRLSESRFRNGIEICHGDSECNKYSNSMMNYFSLGEILKSKLSDYQKDNIDWMLELEKTPLTDYFQVINYYFYQMAEFLITQGIRSSLMKNEF